MEAREKRGAARRAAQHLDPRRPFARMGEEPVQPGLQQPR
jgi:hypothetical protein